MESERERRTWAAELASRFVEMRCTDGVMAGLSLAIGAVGILLQTVGLVTESWIFIVEAVEVAKGTEFVDPVERLFIFNMGYWRICREFYFENITEKLDFINRTGSLNRSCIVSAFFTSNDDLGQFGKAAIAIMNHIQFSSVTHVLSLAMIVVAILLSGLGHMQKNKKTLIGSVIFVTAGFLMVVAVMQYICVVDDEMTPRLKPKATGEPSQYKYHHGGSFVASALSFICIQMCAILNLLIYWRRYKSVDAKVKLIPGLRERIAKMKEYRELGLPVPSPKKSPSPFHTGNDEFHFTEV